MGGKKRTRSGRERANKRNNTNSRHKEEAELQRLSRLVAEIPTFSNRFQVFRQNRRQKAKRNEQLHNPLKPIDKIEPLIFRATRFSDFPLSQRTLDGLASGGFTELTPIQKNAIPQGLAGRDVLAAAPTGSGKTLSFLVPLLESLWRSKWNTMDGLGALVLSPTRELSMQIFQVLRSVARKHTISAGLVIGGKDFESESGKVGNMNVLVATPGRMLHHMDHAVDMDCSNLQVLVLDEADRILDMGFAKTLDAILANLPSERQTLLFSATQTKSIKALARLSLRNPEYVAVANHEGVDHADGNPTDIDTEKEKNDSDAPARFIKVVGTPKGLSQSYSVVSSHDKLSVLWSFIKTHLKSKMIIFMSSGKQVRFVYETFCKMRPGMSLLHLHGNMKQLRRTDVYDLFCRTKSAALFATDVASRGLDFPDVEWVIQLDCPDDVGSYIHRVGRTARFKSHGRAMLLLREGKEENFLGKLKERNIELHRTKINPDRITSIQPRVAAAVASNQELRKLAQRAFSFYLRSLYLQRDKDVFDVKELDFSLLAKSFGLSVTPRITFKEGSEGKSGPSTGMGRKKSVFGYEVHTDQKESTAKGEVSNDKSDVGIIPRAESENIDDTGLTLKKVHAFAWGQSDDSKEESDDGKEESEVPNVQRRKRKKRKLDLLKNLPSANRIVFQEDGTAVRAGDLVSDDDDIGPEQETVAEHEGIAEYAATVSKRLEMAAGADRDRERERVRSVHAKQKAKRRELNKIIRPSASAVQEMLALAGGGDNDSHQESNQDSDDSSDSDSSSDDDSTENSEGTDLGRGDLAEEERHALRILQSRR